MKDQIGSHCQMTDAQIIHREIENLGKVCKEELKRELKGKYISITTDH